MESNLNDILSRINFKLSCYTQENSQIKDTKFYNKDEHSKTQSNDYIRHHLKHDRQIVSQKDIQKDRDLDAYLKGKEKVRNRVMNEEQEEMSAQKNKNKIQKYEQFKGFRSFQRIKRPQIVAGMEDSRLQYHQQAFFSLKQRNQTLENDVKMLQDKLKQLQRSMEKGKNEKSRTKETPTSSKNINNELYKVSNHPNNFKKVSNHIKSYPWIPNGSNSNHRVENQKNSRVNKETSNINSPKHHIPRPNLKPKHPKEQKPLVNQNRESGIKNNEGEIIQTSLHNLLSLEGLSNQSKKWISNINISRANENESKHLIKCKTNGSLRSHNKDSSINSKPRNKDFSGRNQSALSSGSQRSHTKCMNVSNHPNSSKFEKQNPLQNSKLNKVSRKKVQKHSRVVMEQNKLH